VSDVDADIIVDERLRAALLWDVPRLQGDDGGLQQWRRALRLDFINLGPLDDEDVVSLAAHAVEAGMTGQTERVDNYALALTRLGPAGSLMESLLSLWLERDIDGSAEVVASTMALVGRVAETELRARLLMRLAYFATARGLSEHVRTAIGDAVALTSPETRLGVVARRQAFGHGIEIAGFEPFEPTSTPDDPLLTLPWVRTTALEAAAALSAQRLEKALSGTWDTSFHWGRTKLDDLLAAHAQAEWCGAVDLRDLVRRLVSSHMLLEGEASPEQTQWALLAWATLPSAQRVSAAVRGAERQLDSTAAADLLKAVADDGFASRQSYLEVAAGVWDVLDQSDAEALLVELAGLLPAPDIPPLRTLLANLLWRLPESWSRCFSAADEVTRTGMLEGLSPEHVDTMPAGLRETVLEHQRAHEVVPTRALELALRVAQDYSPEPAVWSKITPSELLQLLEWRASAVASQHVEAAVDQTLVAVHAEREQAERGHWGIGGSDNRELLGRLAAHLAVRREDVVIALLGALIDRPTRVEWQLGALEGLSAMRRSEQLEEGDIQELHGLDLEPGEALFGEQAPASLLRAAQLRACAPQLTSDDLRWLAVCSRGSHVQSRLVALAALREVAEIDDPTIDWSLVGGLFDPQDDVVIQAVVSFATRREPAAGALTVARSRLQELYRSASRRVRREVIVVAGRRPELGIAELVAAARSDRAWTVRRAADQAAQGYPTDPV